MLVLSKGNFLGQTEWIGAGGLITSISRYPSIVPYDEPSHCHETVHVSMMLRGGNIEQRGMKTAESLPGTVTIYDAGEEHFSRNIVPDSCQVNLELTDEFLNLYDLSGSVGKLKSAGPAELRLLMLKVYKELMTGDPESSINISSGLLAILTVQEKYGAAVPRWVRPVKEMLHDHWHEPLTLTELAQVVGLHPANLSGYFPKYFGCTIGEYRRKIKIQKALDLIHSDTRSLTDIAYLAGFADQSHFIRVCKELTGWRPRQLGKIYH